MTNENTSANDFILRAIRPISSELIAGFQDEPLVVKNLWESGKSEMRRVVNSERSYQIPTFVFWDETVSLVQQETVRESLHELYTELGLEYTKVHFLENWKESDYKDSSGRLIPRKSIEWQFESQWDALRKQYNAQHIVNAMFDDPHQTISPHWEVLLTNKDIYQFGTNFVIGSAYHDLGTVISLGRLEQIPDVRMRREAQKTEIYHEFSHVLGLPTKRRGVSKLNKSLGDHCLSYGCSLKQGLRVPTDWIAITTERLKLGGKPLCGECVTDFKTKFTRELK